jgi:hypothetical protein
VSRSILVSFALIVLLSAGSATSGVVSWTSPSSGDARSHWTAERLADAIPVEMPVVLAREEVLPAEAAALAGPAFGHPASPPVLRIAP